ncbi:MAG: hypothetical protein IPM33_13710 [Phycisphaerales bacterium]|nr:hypothetical protein [Phycisphaerales bacterium]
MGYVRLSQFTETTADELARAAASLKQSGLNGLVLDLRFNPGGLLDQARQGLTPVRQCRADASSA